MKQEWLLILIVSVLMMGCIGIDAWHFPKETERGEHTPLGIVAGLLHMFGAGLWITMDRTRRGLEVGKWRFAAVFLGPIGLCAYFILEYRAKALVLMPLLLALYFAIGFVPLFTVLILRHVLG